MEDLAAPDPDLAELVTLGLRLARVVTAIGEAEQRLVDHATRGLPDSPTLAGSLAEATAGGLAFDATAEAVAKANPRIAALTQCYDRLARAIRRAVALKRRIQAGWPGPRAVADDRASLTLRQAIRSARERIQARAEDDTDAAERLFADLSARLDDPEFTHQLRDRPVEEIIETLCRAIGLGPATKTPPDIAAIAGMGRGPSPDLGRDPGGGANFEK